MPEQHRPRKKGQGKRTKMSLYIDVTLGEQLRERQAALQAQGATVTISDIVNVALQQHFERDPIHGIKI